MRAPAWTDEQEDWLRRFYGTSDVHEVTADLNERFGTQRSEKAVYARAYRLGLHRPPTRRTYAARTVRWSKEPEMEAFMLENDRGSIAAISAKFAERFGFQLSQSQVTGFRSSHGTQSKAGVQRANEWNALPIGSVRERGGYRYVKVRDETVTPGSRDNWIPEHVAVWEKANGTALPDDHQLMFADRDRTNLDPGNLVPVPRRLVALLNRPPNDGWHDRASLEACILMARLQTAIVDAACRPRTCCRCGRTFTPRFRSIAAGTVRTCPECVDAGLLPTHGKDETMGEDGIMDSWLMKQLEDDGDDDFAEGCLRIGGLGSVKVSYFIPDGMICTDEETDAGADGVEDGDSAEDDDGCDDQAPDTGVRG